MIASDFLYGIGRLVRSGELDPKSPFVVAAEASLGTAVASQISEARPALDFLEKASGDLEASIASAIKITLR